MNFLVNHNEDIYKVWKNYRGNLKLTSLDIQKDIVKVAATVTTQVILDDLGDDLFAILIDESHDISVKEQMVVVIRYVNNEEKVIECFLGVVHVSNTSALTLKSGLESLFAKYGLSLSRIRGQGYDGAMIDRQLQELNNHFPEVNTELLLCVACLSPRDSFSAFDKERLIRLAQFYPSEFSQVELLTLDCQLENYFLDVCSDSEFSELEGIDDLSIKLVETKKYVVYPLVYLLLKLSLILPVATTIAEKAFSAMNIIKNRMRNRMGDDWLNDCYTYIERDIFVDVENEKIIQHFQNMKNRREQL
ncbi:hypothetical protein KIW84_024574 [Lathyrus oleraceus]|uniref:DUF4371 domain-containing protein n=1 Tax=Pisum sativum TaxID=3888 RepID=A0A9D4YG04_PEA|nr:hypothetical protein KIW84_024574 [Pisum sativum]